MRGRLRVAVVLGGAAALALLLVISPWSDGGSGSPPSPGGSSGSGGPARSPRRPLRLTAQVSAPSLPAPISGEAVAARGSDLLVIGGLDGRGVSTSAVREFNPRAGTIRQAGSLSEPIHDAAAATLRGGDLVFGGGSATTLDAVERLLPGRTARVTGRLPQARSDLSVARVRGSAIVLGGYDGIGTPGAVLRTRDGRSFTTIAELPAPVPNAAAGVAAETGYLFGGLDRGGVPQASIVTVRLSRSAPHEPQA